MNYLAHAYLSFDVPEITVGNLISDFVKGKKKLDFPMSIQQGISLHRAIDAFTDGHPVNKEARVYFREYYGLYSGALIDVSYDHFLANDMQEFPQAADLADFAQSVYRNVLPFQAMFPERFARLFPYMQSQNWLYNYRYKEGIFNSFAGLVKRAAYMKPAGEACRIFEERYESLQSCFRLFFPELKAFARSALEAMQGGDAGGFPGPG